MINVSVLVDPQPDPVGAAVHHADARRPDELPGDEDPELPGHRPADGHRHRVAARRAPAQLETEVARKIENSIATLQGVKHIYTKVQDGTATITVEFRLEKPTQEARRRRARRGRAGALRPARRPARPGHHEDGPRRRADPDLHRRVDAHGRRGAVLVRRQPRSRKALLAVRGVGAVSARRRRRRARCASSSTRRALLALNATAADISRQLRQIAAGSVGRPRRRRRRRAVGAHDRHRAVGRASWRAMEITLTDGRRIRLDQVATVSDTVAEQRCGRAARTASRWSASRSSRSRGAGEIEVAARRARRAREAEGRAPRHRDHRGVQLRRPGARRTTTARWSCCTKARCSRCWSSGCSCATGARRWSRRRRCRCR